MAQIITRKDNPQQWPDVLEWIKAKQRNEQAMLLRLNNQFKKRIPRKKMCALLRTAFDQMLSQVDDPSSPAIQSVSKEGGLAVWTEHVPNRVDDSGRLIGIHKKLVDGERAMPKPLDCNDFSELIRVVGDWLERGGASWGDPIADTENINKALRTGVHAVEVDHTLRQPYLWYVRQLRKYYGWAYADRLTAVERDTLARLASTGDFIARQTARDDITWRDARSRDGRNENPHPIEDHLTDFWVRPKHDRQSGLEMFRVNGEDLCRKIDLLFGLHKGATISGTTTDTVFVLEAFGAASNLHAGYYIFPVATIAASLHHTLVEAGLALTLVEAIDSYCVGFYSTLTPKGGFPGELDEVAGVLKEAEDADANRHFILWYDTNELEPEGCVLWDQPWQIRESKRLVEGRGLLKHAIGLPSLPKRDDVIRFIQLMAPKLLAALPQEFQHLPSRV